MTLKEYYVKYLSLHQDPVCRRLHVVGNLLTLLYVCYCVSSGAFFALIFAPFIVYPFAWIGHVYYEKNKPAAWSNPVMAKLCDWIMIKDILTGKIKW